MDNWNDLQLFWSESWMMKCMHGLGRTYEPADDIYPTVVRVMRTVNLHDCLANCYFIKPKDKIAVKANTPIIVFLIPCIQQA